MRRRRLDERGADRAAAHRAVRGHAAAVAGRAHGSGVGRGAAAARRGCRGDGPRGDVDLADQGQQVEGVADGRGAGHLAGEDPRVGPSDVAVLHRRGAQPASEGSDPGRVARHGAGGAGLRSGSSEGRERMTNYESAEIGTISSSGAADVIREMADAAAARGVVELVEGRSLGVILAPGQQLHEIDLDALADTPQRKTGGVQVTNAASFALYVNRHSSRLGSTLWANQATSQIVAVLDDHQRKDDAPNGDSDVPSKPSAGLPGWGEHRATLTLPLTPDWLLWTKQDGELMDQQSFAEHIEDGAGAIHDPEPAAMLELAQTFHANTGVEFKSSNRLQSGETQLRYEETTHAKAGRTGKIAIPDSLELHLQP